MNQPFSESPADEETAFDRKTSASHNSRTVDVVPIITQASLLLLSRLVFGFSSNSKATSPISSQSSQSVFGTGYSEDIRYYKMTYDELVHRLSDEFLVLWKLIRTNTLLFTTVQLSQRTRSLAVSVRSVKSLLQTLIIRRIDVLNSRVQVKTTDYTDNNKDKNREMQYCVLDGLLPYLKSSITPPPPPPTAESNIINETSVRSVVNTENNEIIHDANKSKNNNNDNGNNSNNKISGDKVQGSLSSDTKHMTSEELIHNLNNLLLAGFETTAHSLVVSLHHLAHLSPSTAAATALLHSVPVPVSVNKYEGVNDKISNSNSISNNSNNSTSSTSNRSTERGNDTYSYTVPRKSAVKALVRESLRLHPPVLQAARVCRREAPVLLPPPSTTKSQSNGNQDNNISQQSTATVTATRDDHNNVSQLTKEGWMCPEGTSVILDFVSIMRHPAVWSKIYCDACTKKRNSSSTSVNGMSDGAFTLSSPDSFNLHRWINIPPPNNSESNNNDKDKNSNSACPQCELLLERRTQHWIPFGVGPKSCIGRGVALYATEGLLLRLLSSFTFSPPQSQGTDDGNDIKGDGEGSHHYHNSNNCSNSTVATNLFYALPAVDQTPTLRFTQGLQLHVTALPKD